jgi:hypothetical protein
MNAEQPTNELYQAFTKAYDFFNAELFGGELSPCIVTVQRGKPYYGFFAPNRWKNDNGQRVHEIAMNTAYFHEQSLIAIFQTLVHEMCHLWQFDYGKPSRSGYHNKQWADKMESIGLMPSDTFKEGGARTGQKMGDYPLDGGKFQAACEKLVASGYFIKWIDRTLLRLPPNLNEPPEKQPENEIQAILAAPLVNFNPDDVISQITQTTSKNRYVCPCGCKVWGKKGLNILCGRCGSPFEYQESNAQSNDNQEP